VIEIANVGVCEENSVEAPYPYESYTCTRVNSDYLYFRTCTGSP